MAVPFGQGFAWLSRIHPNTHTLYSDLCPLNWGNYDLELDIESYKSKCPNFASRLKNERKLKSANIKPKKKTKVQMNQDDEY